MSEVSMDQDDYEVFDNGEQTSSKRKETGGSEQTAINLDKEDEELIIDEGKPLQCDINDKDCNDEGMKIISESENSVKLVEIAALMDEEIVDVETDVTLSNEDWIPKMEFTNGLEDLICHTEENSKTNCSDSSSANADDGSGVLSGNDRVAVSSHDKLNTERNNDVRVMDNNRCHRHKMLFEKDISHLNEINDKLQNFLSLQCIDCKSILDIKAIMNKITVNSNCTGGNAENVLVIVDENSLDAEDNNFDDYETFKELMLAKKTFVFVDDVNKDNAAVIAYCEGNKSDGLVRNGEASDNLPNGNNVYLEKNIEGDSNNLIGCTLLHTAGLESLKETVDSLKKRRSTLEVIDIDSSGDESNRDVVILSSEDESNGQCSKMSCGLCKFVAESSSDLTFHIDSVHKGIEICSCLRCRYVCQSNLNKYFSVVNKPFSCRCCNRSFVRMFDLKRHFIRLHKSVSPLKCNLCDFRTNIVYDLKVHTSILHDDDKGFPCMYCDEKIDNRRDLFRHVAKMHDKAMSFKCNICGKRKISKPKMLMHIKVYHLGMKRHRCSACDFNTDQKDQLIKHIKLYHLTCNKKMFHCGICHMKFTSHISLQRHIIKRHSDWGREQSNAEPECHKVVRSHLTVERKND